MAPQPTASDSLRVFMRMVLEMAGHRVSTASTAEEALGADAFLQKPFGSDRLLHVLSPRVPAG